MARVHDIEDYLQDKGVFENGISGGHAHMDSYMTVINFPNLKKAYEDATFTKADWEEAIKYWKYHEYLSPTIKLTRLTIERYIGI